MKKKCHVLIFLSSMLSVKEPFKIIAVDFLFFFFFFSVSKKIRLNILCESLASRKQIRISSLLL